MEKLLMILRIIPALVEIIKTVEGMLPESGKGKEKLELVRQILTIGYEAIDDYWPMLEGIVELIVKFFNKNKVFDSNSIV